MPNVFVPNRSGHDISALAEYGTVHILTEGTQVVAFHRHYRIFSDIMQGITEDDFIVVLGPASLVALAAAIAAHKLGRVRFLLFHKGRYQERSIVLGVPANIKEDVNA